MSVVLSRLANLYNQHKTDRVLAEKNKFAVIASVFLPWSLGNSLETITIHPVCWYIVQRSSKQLTKQLWSIKITLQYIVFDITIKKRGNGSSYVKASSYIKVKAITKAIECNSTQSTWHSSIIALQKSLQASKNISVMKRNANEFKCTGLIKLRLSW